MKLTELFLTELDREVERSRRALEQVPPGKFDWKPHEKSMIFGYLANMVATIPSWLVMEITQNELDVAPAGGGQMDPSRKETSDALIEALDRSAADARSALEKTSDEHLMTSWKLLARGQVATRHDPRHDQPLGASPRADDCLSAADGRESPRPLRTVGGRHSVSVDRHHGIGGRPDRSGPVGSGPPSS